MYQAQITDTKTGAPVTDQATADQISQSLAVRAAEAVDAEQGIWLVDLGHADETRLEQDGYLTIQIDGYTVEIDLP